MTVVQPDLCLVCDPDKVDNLGCGVSPVLIAEILSSKIIKKTLIDYQESG